MDSSLSYLPQTDAVPGPPPFPDGPYDVDTRAFTPEAMDEHDEYTAALLAVTELAA
jgi:hypothetical protein